MPTPVSETSRSARPSAAAHAEGKVSGSYARTGAQYAKFSLVGVANAAVDVGVLNLLLLIDPTRAPGRLVLYNVVALAATNVNIYLWNTLWTFGKRARHDARQAGLFALQAVLGAGASSLVLWLEPDGLRPTPTSRRFWAAIWPRRSPCWSARPSAFCSCVSSSSDRRGVERSWRRGASEGTGPFAPSGGFGGGRLYFGA